MTADEMNADLNEVRNILMDTFCTAKLCEHPTIDHTVIWIFDTSGKQIGAITRLLGEEKERSTTFNTKFDFRVSGIRSGVPVSQIHCDTLLECIEHILDVNKKK
jgi:hypothetical protein